MPGISADIEEDQLISREHPRRRLIPSGRSPILLLISTIAITIWPPAALGSAQGEALGLHLRQSHDSGSIAGVDIYNLNPLLQLPLSHSYPGNERLSHDLTADYNGALAWETDGSEFYDGWTPQGALKEVVWGSEHIDADGAAVFNSPLRRKLIQEQRRYPDPRGNPGSFHTWKPTRRPHPPGMVPNGSLPIGSTWGKIVTGPDGDDTDCRSSTTRNPGHTRRQSFHPRGWVGAIRCFREQIKSWPPDAQSTDHVDRNLPGHGLPVRAGYHRCERQAPSGGIGDRVRVEGPLHRTSSETQEARS